MEKGGKEKKKKKCSTYRSGTLLDSLHGVLDLEQVAVRGEHSQCAVVAHSSTIENRKKFVKK